MSVCTVCHAEFPDRLLARLVLGESIIPSCCPICALRLRNELCGLPTNAPFCGRMAQQVYEEAVEYRQKHDQDSV